MTTHNVIIDENGTEIETDYPETVKASVTCYAHAPPNPHGGTYYAVIDPETGEGYGHSVDEATALVIAEHDGAKRHVKLAVEKRQIVYIMTGYKGN